MTRFGSGTGEAGGRASRPGTRRVAGGAGRSASRLAVLLGGLALGAAVLTDSVRAQATLGSPQDPRYKNVSCANGGRTGTADFIDELGMTHQLWYENFGFRSGDPKSPGGWYEMGTSLTGSELPRDHRVSGAFDDDVHSLNGTNHPPQEDLDHAHAFNMMQGLLKICTNTEG
jgi:hypothetical protein